MRTREPSYLLSSHRQGETLVQFLLRFVIFFFNYKCIEMKILLVKTGWLLFEVPCVHLLYPANEFVSVLLLCKYNFLANLSARNFTQTTCFKQILEHTNERQCLHLQNIFLKPKSRCHNHLPKVNFTCTRDFTDLRTAAVLE